MAKSFFFLLLSLVAWSRETSIGCGSRRCIFPDSRTRRSLLVGLLNFSVVGSVAGPKSQAGFAFRQPLVRDLRRAVTHRTHLFLPFPRSFSLSLQASLLGVQHTSRISTRRSNIGEGVRFSKRVKEVTAFAKRRRPRQAAQTSAVLLTKYTHLFDSRPWLSLVFHPLVFSSFDEERTLYFLCGCLRKLSILPQSILVSHLHSDMLPKTLCVALIFVFDMLKTGPHYFSETSFHRIVASPKCNFAESLFCRKKNCPKSFHRIVTWPNRRISETS